MEQERDILKICTYPDKVLRRRADIIEEIDEEVLETARRMAITMHENAGAGLAAPQVGVSSKLIVINPTGEPEDQQILINPTIVERRGDMEGVEGCLSVPGVSGIVRRSAQVTVVGYDLDGNEVEIKAADFLARVLQHEIDHLEGMLLIDRMKPESRIEVREALKSLELYGKPLCEGEDGE